MPPFAYRVLFAEISLLLFIATAKLPFEFYSFLRGSVAIAGLFLAYRGYKLRNWLWVLPGLGAFFLFAAMFGFEFPKATWIPIDIAFGAVFLLASYLLGKPHMVKDPESRTGELKLEEEAESWKTVFFVVTLVLFLFYAMTGHGAAPGGCDEWVDDMRGGYCA